MPLTLQGEHFRNLEMHPNLQRTSYHRTPKQSDQPDPRPSRMRHWVSRHTIFLILRVRSTARQNPTGSIYHVPDRLLWLFPLHHCHLYGGCESLHGVGESPQKVGTEVSPRAEEVCHEEDFYFFSAAKSSNGREFRGSFYSTGRAGFLCSDDCIDADVVAVNFT